MLVQIYVMIYVDDIIITSSSSTIIDALLLGLKAEFFIMDLGPFSYFLGIEAHYFFGGLLLC
jgi:hypothetical protein